MAGRNPTPNLTSASMPQSAAVQAFIAGVPFQSKWNSYYSRLHIPAASGGGGGGTPYTVAAGIEYFGFGYSRGQDMAAGGAAGTVATYCDTNIQTASQTISGESIEIDGVGLILLTSSDANLAKALDPVVSVKIRMNGATDFPMGIPSMLPGPGGLFGASEAQSVLPDQLSQAGIVVGALSNGIPFAGNYFSLPEPMVWACAGHPDSTLNVILKTERAVTTIAQYSGATRAAVAGGATTSGTAAYTQPAASAIYVDYMVVVVGRTVTGISDN
jgi:hypothetical protein